MHKPPAPSLRQRALQHLAQREHTRQELHGKLLRWARALELAASSALPAAGASDCPGGRDGGAVMPSTAGGSAPGRTSTPVPTAAEIDALLDLLEQGGQLSDARFVESRVHARAARFGNRRIEHELRQHGTEAPQALRQALESTELDRAWAVWERKFGRPPASAAERARHLRFLAGRGFSADTVRQVLRRCGGAATSAPIGADCGNDGDDVVLSPP
jgi:regulatory protein